MRRPVRALPLLLVVGAACVSAGGTPAGQGDYFSDLARVSQNAHIQERGLQRALRTRLERSDTPDERLSVIEIHVDQAARLYEDVVDALADLDPADGLEAAHQAYVDAWAQRSELIVKVRDAGFRTVPDYLAALETPAMTEAGESVRSACQELQAIAAAADRQVDLACEGRPT